MVLLLTRGTNAHRESSLPAVYQCAVPRVQRAKAELDAEVAALAKGLQQMRSIRGEACQLADDITKAAELAAAAHQVPDQSLNP